MNAFYDGSHRYLAQDDIDGIQSIYGNRTVVRTTNLGCAGGVFFINNLPNGATVFWTSSNTSIATVANNLNQGTVSRVGSSNGTVRITGTITLPCGTTVIEFMDISIGFGTNSINYTQKEITCVNSKPYFYGAVVPIAFAGNNYDWYSKDESNPSNPFILKQSGLGNTADFPLGNNKGNRYYTIRVIVSNPCGTLQSIDAEGYLYAPSCNSGLRVMTSPNPSSNTMTIRTVDESGQPSIDPNEKFYELQLANKQGNIVRQQKYNTGRNQATINLSNLQADVYYLRLWNGKEWTTTSVIKK